MFKTIKNNRKTLSEEVVEEIINAIEKKIWVDGDKLPSENKLAQEFGVSRNCVREALKSLSMNGIIKSNPGKGTFIVDGALQKIRNRGLLELISDREILDDLMEIRFILETEMAYLAAKRATEEEKEKLRDIKDKFKESVITNGNWKELGPKFHMIIAEIAHNKILLKLIGMINGELKSQRNHLDINNYKEFMINDHQKICDAIIEGNPEKARKAMYEHLKKSESGYK